MTILERDSWIPDLDRVSTAQAVLSPSIWWWSNLNYRIYGYLTLIDRYVSKLHSQRLIEQAPVHSLSD